MYTHNNHLAISRYGEVVADFSADFAINNSEFEIGKTTYTLNIHAVAGNKVADFDIVYTCDGNTIPAVSLFTTGQQDLPQPLGHVTGCMSAGNQDDYGYTISMYRAIDSHVLSRSIVENCNDFGANISVNEGNNTRLIYGKFIPFDGNSSAIMTITADFPIFVDSTSEVVYSGEESQDWRYITHGFNSAKLETSASGISSTYMSQIASGAYENINKALNYYSVANEIPANKVWDILNYLKVDGTITESKAYNFRILPDAKIGLYVDERINGDGSPNMHLRISRYPCYVKPFYAPDSAYTEASSVDSDYWWGDWTDYDDGTSYIGYGATNIPIYRSEADLQKYFDGELGIEDSINGGGSSIKTSTIGDDLQSTDIPTVNLATSGVGCYIYALSESQIKNLMANYLYVTDATLLQNISEALWLWGNNPIDFFIDCYYVPFDITNFYTTVNADMKFGTYRFDSTQGWSTFPIVQETNGTRLTLFDTTFEGIYGDWRDYKQFDYDLFLPFYGFFRLDLFKYLNKRVKCEMMFDVTTHNLRYYLYADGVITDRIDSSVGINLPLMSSDMVNKAKSDRLAEREQRKTYASVGASVASGTVGVVAGLASGSVFTAVNSGTNAINTIIDSKYNLEALSDSINSNMTESVNGSFSGSMNIYDIRYAYLRITERELIIPDQLHELYNYPSYYMGSASELSGYCEISDIRLQSFTGTIEELNALKSALREGVIF